MKLSKKILAIVLSVLLTFSAVSSAAVFAIENESENDVAYSLPFVAVSDIHYYPQSYTGNNCEAWQEFCTTDTKEYQESEALIYAALASITEKAKTEGYKYLLIPGDLTKDSEYQAHIELAAILENFEKETGIQVLVTNGNHDISVNDACTFENGTMETARSITMAEFREVYKNLGYDLATETYTPSEGTQNGLSYAADLGDYVLIVVDSCIYDPDTAVKQTTGGEITEETMEWIISVAEKAYEDGKTPIAMTHHSLTAHMELEPSVTKAFCVDNYEWVASYFADAGINFVFTGHQHTTDISSYVSDNGNVLYDCEVCSLTGYPNAIRECEIITYKNGISEINYSSFDVDFAQEITVNGVTYEKPFSVSSFAINFGGRFSEDGYADAEELLMGIVKNYLLPYVDKISQAGSILQFLKTDFDLDLKALLGNLLYDYIGDGVQVLGVNLFSVDNIMWFIEDLLSQIQALYIDNPENLLSLIEAVIHKLGSLELSEIPCTKFIDTFHFGDASTPGTFADFLLSAMYYWYTGNEDCSDDAFVLDVIARFEDGTNVQLLIDTLLDIILNDIVDEAILSKLQINIGTLFDKSNPIGNAFGCSADYFVSKILLGDTSYMNLVNIVFSFGILPYDSLGGIVDELYNEYITASQIDSLGENFAYCISDFVIDSNPQKLGDDNVTYSSEKHEVEATAENYRLPSMISLTLGSDSTSANISWFTKTSVDGSTVKVYDENGNIADCDIEVTSQTVEVGYPGIDIGIIGFFYYNFELTRYTATISGLEKNTTYTYKLGCEERNWWSDIGTITTADGSDKVTFIHTTDSQAQTLEQYELGWANTLSKAFEMFDVDVILHSGDHIDNPKNIKQWNWLFNTASEQLMSTYFLPTSGNHEDMGEYAIVDKFFLSNLPEQDTTTGAYYSADYNNVHFIILNTNDQNEDGTLSDKQVEWLKEDVASSDADWTVVSLHKAIYSNGSHYDDDEICALRDQLSVLMPELGIDIVFQGHDHVYLRTYPMDSNIVSATERVYLNYNSKQYLTDVLPTGTSYVIGGTSGVKTYIPKDNSLTDELFPRAEKIIEVDSSVFSVVQIDGGVLYFDAYSVDGDTVTNIDSFAIQKDLDAGEFVSDAEDVSGGENNSTSDCNSFLEFLETLLSYLKTLFKILGFFHTVGTSW